MDVLAESVNKFLSFNEYKVLDGLGTITHERAVNKAAKEYDSFNKTQKINSDFDKQIKALEQKNKKK